MSIPKRKLLMDSFFISQFDYYPLVWMCHSRLMNNKVNRLHEKCLCIVYSDKTSSFEELLDKDRSVIIHKINIHVLAIEMFKVYRKLSSNIVTETFRAHWNNDNLRHSSFFFYTLRLYCLSRSESLSNFGPRTWDLVTNTLKELDDVNSSKTKI